MSGATAYLIYIRDTIADIERLAEDGREAVETDRVKRAALLYFLHTLAEATQRIPEELTIQYPEIDWIAISGFRNRLVHGYLEINMNVVWRVVIEDLPSLKAAIHTMLENSAADENNP